MAVNPVDRFLENANPEAARVKFTGAPIVLLCGGALPRPDEVVAGGHLSLRHRLSDNSSSYEQFLPEEISEWNDDAVYKNLVAYEKDLAGICSLVVVILESPGSMAELGAFSQLHELAAKMITIVPTAHADSNSFINLGILRHLRELNSSSVRGFPWQLDPASGLLVVDDDTVRDIDEDIREGLRSQPGESKFKAAINSHVMVLIVGLIDLFGALKQNEILDHLARFGVNVDLSDLRAKLFLLQRFQLIVQRTYGDAKYFLPEYRQKFHELVYGVPTGNPEFDVPRIKLMIRKFYEEHDKRRHRAIGIQPSAGIRNE